VLSIADEDRDDIIECIAMLCLQTVRSPSTSRSIRAVYLGNTGYVDMYKAMEIYYDVGFDGIFIDDHVPQTYQDTPWGHRGRAFANGYIQALIEAVTKQRQAAGIAPGTIKNWTPEPVPA
jgi:hypothetical protein